MIERLIKPSKNRSFFLLGARQTGKSTLLKSMFEPSETIFYDLLKLETFLRLQANPVFFRQDIVGRKAGIKTVVVDEVQKISGLLDEVHSLIEEDKSLVFCLSGSSARKLKKSQANLLAGRASVFHLYPLTSVELGNDFNLIKALEIGTLPQVYLQEDRSLAQQILRDYVDTYLKEEIQQEAVVRRLASFSQFLTLAAEESGHLINYSHLAREIGISYNTVKDYYQVLEDTLCGFTLMAFEKTTRRRLAKQCKFYFFDSGIQRAISRKITTELRAGSSEYGQFFEQFFINEVFRLSDYVKNDFQFRFYRSSQGAEVDLIIETPKNECIAIEIKSTDRVTPSMLSGLRSFSQIEPKAKLFCVSTVPQEFSMQNIRVMPWQDMLMELGF